MLASVQDVGIAACSCPPQGAAPRKQLRALAHGGRTLRRAGQRTSAIIHWNPYVVGRFLEGQSKSRGVVRGIADPPLVGGKGFPLLSPATQYFSYSPLIYISTTIKSTRHGYKIRALRALPVLGTVRAAACREPWTKSCLRARSPLGERRSLQHLEMVLLFDRHSLVCLSRCSNSQPVHRLCCALLRLVN